MVFIILIGAAMLTSAFRAFGGEDLVREYLTSLPGGFWAQFIVVMAVIFLLGFFLDFIEIAVVVIPHRRSDPAGGPGRQHHRGVVGGDGGAQHPDLVPHPAVRLQPCSTCEAWRRPSSRPWRSTAAPPSSSCCNSSASPSPARSEPGELSAEPNLPELRDCASADEPEAQHCLEGVRLRPVRRARRRAALPHRSGRRPGRRIPPRRPSQEVRRQLRSRAASFGLAQAVRDADAAVQAYLTEYRPLHLEVRRKQSDLRKARETLERLEQDRSRLARDEAASDEDRDSVEPGDRAGRGGDGRDRGRHPGRVGGCEGALRPALETPGRRPAASIGKALTRRTRPSRSAALIADADALRAFEPTLSSLEAWSPTNHGARRWRSSRRAERELGKVAGSSRVKGRLSKASGRCAATHRIQRRPRGSWPRRE